MAIATATALALAASLAASGAAAYNTKKTADKQDSVAAAGITKQAENQRQVNAKLNKTLDNTAASKPDDVVRDANGSYLEAIQRQMAGANAGLAKRGISDQYDQLAGESSAQAGDYASTIAGLLSRIDGGQMQRQNEGNSFGNLGMDLGAMQGNIQGDAFLNDMALKNVRRNPYIDLAAGALSAYGGAAGGKGGKYTASGTGPVSGINYVAPATRGGNSWLNGYGRN